MKDLIQIISVPIIAAIVYGALAGYKILVDGNEKWTRVIPVIAGALGVVLGIVAFYAAPEIIAADNVLTAILIGGASGLAATGTNQIWKQLTKNNVDTAGSNGSAASAAGGSSANTDNASVAKGDDNDAGTKN